jgi:hypothetical protein
MLGNDANIIRWGEPNQFNPDGYFRYYNSSGQPIDPPTGFGTPDNSPLSHIQPDYEGPLTNYPGR